MNRLAVATVVALAICVGGPAWADIAPPPGYVETCTVERMSEGGDSCIECRGSFQDREACAGEWEPQGYDKRCQTRGASVWTEIWCTSADGSGTDAPDDAAPSDDEAAAADEGSTDDAATEATDETGADETGADEAGEDEAGDDEAQETAPADPPARSRGCSAADGSAPAAAFAFALCGLAVARRRR